MSFSLLLRWEIGAKKDSLLEKIIMASPESTEQTSPKIEFIQYHLPAMTAGDYTITVSQHLITEPVALPLNSPSVQPGIDKKFPSITKKFEVAGERFSLKPEDVVSRFPAPDSLGDHSNVLPHIILNKSTLPWERKTDGKNNDFPWLALLVFGPDEAPVMGDPVTLESIKAEDSTIWMPDFEYETGQNPQDKVNIIDVDQDLLKGILPNQYELSFLAHVRQGLDIYDNPVGNEKAVIIANRLPKQGVVSTVHLVSLENYFGVELEAGDLIRHLDSNSAHDIPAEIIAQFTENGINLSQDLKKSSIESEESWSIYDHANERRYKIWKETRGGQEYLKIGIVKWSDSDGKKVRLISLQNWSFSCTSHEKSFKGIIENLNINPATTRINSLTASSPAYPYIKAGLSPHLHKFGRGNQTVSWFRGPFSTGNPPNPTINLPVLTADQLMFYFPDTGMFDVSYAAAWELGRLLCLQNKSVSTALYKWKRQHAQLIREVENRLTHLPAHKANILQAENLEIPETVSGWFQKVSLLEGVPFNYLIPGEEILPKESLRFFQLDPFWIQCLLDGAFSIGRVNNQELERDTNHRSATRLNAVVSPFDRVSGFLIRSELVSDWPGLLIDAWEDHLLTLDDRFKSNLDANNFDDSFRSVFSINGRELLSRADNALHLSLEDAEEGQERWTLTDTEQGEDYVIQHNESNLLISLKNKLLRKVYLSDNTLLLLYEGIVRTVDFHLKAETLHFGLDFPDLEHDNFFKKLKNLDGKESGKIIDNLPWRDGVDGVLDIQALSSVIKQKLAKDPFTSAQFALEMTEGVERVRFIIPPLDQ
jgi:hypothetical protein